MIGTKTERESKGKALALCLLLAAFVAATLLLAARPAHAQTTPSTFFVNATNDRADQSPGNGTCYTGVQIIRDGGFIELECTLRAAIQEADALAGADTVAFGIPSAEDAGCDATTGMCTISPASGLPNITEAVTIDGYTQPGASPNTATTGANNAVLKMQLNGANAGSSHGLIIFNGDSVVKGLVINRFAFSGVSTSSGPPNRVQGNYIGTDATGTQALGNGSGVGIGGSNNTVGGTTAGARNVISGNDADGVDIVFGATGNKVVGNYIGTDATGTQDLGNHDEGVSILEAPSNTIGGTTAGARNIISGNDGSGVRIFGADATGNKVVGNRIGTDKNGTAPLGNSGDGVLIFFSEEDSNNTVGGAAGARNTIAFNGANGVTVFSSARNRILSNSIHSNDAFGIDLGFFDGPTPNDPGDADDGPNDLQNFPFLTSATTTTMEGSLNSTSGQTFTIQFFSNPAGENEGQTFIGQTSVTTGPDGNATFSFLPSQAVAAGQTVTTTATDPSGNTSEFSVPATVRDATPPRTTRVVPTEDATGVAPAAKVVAVFSEPMRPSSLNTTTLRVRKVGETASVGATVTYDAATRRATLDPSANLERGASYVATATPGARDVAGNQLDQDPGAPGDQAKSWRFTVRP